MIKQPTISKTKCKGCEKFILMHHKILPCRSCEIIVHSRCAKNVFQYNQTTDQWQCYNCINELPPRYNPFAPVLVHDRHEPVHLDELEDISEINKIHESCKLYNHKELKNHMKLHNQQGQCPTSIFCNIDGNASNFDTFATEITQTNHVFSFIGIAETNIDPELKDLYKIPGYSSEYNNKMPGKLKGTGVGLYIHQSLIYNRIEKLCICSANLETVFVSVSNMDRPLTIGIIYRPPSGSVNDSLNEIEELLCNLPDKNVVLLGDFNFNLFDNNSTPFESILYSTNFIPVISLATHEKPGCSSSLIDNILTNSTENMISAGLLESRFRIIYQFFVS